MTCIKSVMLFSILAIATLLNGAHATSQGQETVDPPIGAETRIIKTDIFNRKQWRKLEAVADSDIAVDQYMICRGFYRTYSGNRTKCRSEAFILVADAEELPVAKYIESKTGQPVKILQLNIREGKLEVAYTENTDTQISKAAVIAPAGNTLSPLPTAINTDGDILKANRVQTFQKDQWKKISSDRYLYCSGFYRKYPVSGLQCRQIDNHFTGSTTPAQETDLKQAIEHGEQHQIAVQRYNERRGGSLVVYYDVLTNAPDTAPSNTVTEPTIEGNDSSESDTFSPGTVFAIVLCTLIIVSTTIQILSNRSSSIPVADYDGRSAGRTVARPATIGELERASDKSSDPVVIARSTPTKVEQSQPQQGKRKIFLD